MKHSFALAVKGIVVKENKILILYRSKKEMEKSLIYKKDRYDLPGGGVRFYETAEEGLLREVYEETKLNVRIIDLFSYYDALRPSIHLSLVTYLCKYESGEVSLSQEHDKYKWLTLDEIKSSKLPPWMKRELERGLKRYIAIEEVY